MTTSVNRNVHDFSSSRSTNKFYMVPLEYFMDYETFLSSYSHLRNERQVTSNLKCSLEQLFGNYKQNTTTLWKKYALKQIQKDYIISFIKCAPPFTIVNHFKTAHDIQTTKRIKKIVAFLWMYFPVAVSLLLPNHKIIKQTELFFFRHHPTYASFETIFLSSHF